MIKGRIYTIRSHQTNKYYIGSTTQKLCKRLQDHRCRYKKNKKYMASFEIIKYNDHYIELLENYECNDKNELRKREGELQREHKDNIVNCRIECRTRKQYVIDNKEEITKRLKQYRENNKEFLIKKRKQHYLDNQERIIKKSADYRENNKELLIKKRKEHYLKNKDVILNRFKQTYTCVCGVVGTKHHKLRHEKTKKHQKYITNNKI